jgi:hypothetical protein
MRSVSSANFSTNAKHEHLPIIIASILELGLAPEARSPARELASPKSASKSASTDRFE